MFGPSLDTGGGGVSSNSSSGGDNRFGSSHNNISYGNSGFQLNNTQLLIVGAVVIAGLFLWGRK